MIGFRVAENWRGLEKSRKLLDKEGTLLSYTVVHSPPAGKENTVPFYLGQVSLEDKITHIMEIVDAEKEKIKKGARVRTCLRRIHMQGRKGLIGYGIKCRVTG